MTVSDSIHLPADFILLNNWIIFCCANVAHFHCPSSADGHLHCFPPPGYCDWSSTEHSWAGVSAAGYRIFGSVFLSGIAGSCGWRIFRNFQADFHSGCTSLHSHQQPIGQSSPFPTTMPASGTVCFFSLDRLTGVRWTQIKVPALIFMVGKDAEFFSFNFMLCVWVSWLKKYFQPFLFHLLRTL